MSLGGDIGSQLIKIVEKVRADLIANDFATKSYVDEIISSGIISKIVFGITYWAYNYKISIFINNLITNH